MKEWFQDLGIEHVVQEKSHSIVHIFNTTSTTITTSISWASCLAHRTYQHESPQRGVVLALVAYLSSLGLIQTWTLRSTLIGMIHYAWKVTFHFCVAGRHCTRIRDRPDGGSICRYVAWLGLTRPFSLHTCTTTSSALGAWQNVAHLASSTYIGSRLTDEMEQSILRPPPNVS